MSTTETTREATRVRTLRECLDEIGLEGLVNLKKGFRFASGNEGCYYTIIGKDEKCSIPSLKVWYYNPRISPDGPEKKSIRLDKRLEDSEYFPL